METQLCLVLMLVFALFETSDSCTPCDLSVPPSGYEVIQYAESNEHLENPSRGFNVLSYGRASSYSPLTVSSLNNYRSRDGITVAWRQFVLDDFVDKDMSSAYLNNIRNDLQTLRDARWTAVVRFCYTTTSRSSAPYGDATKSWMLRHIEQLKPILEEFEDVIDILNAGFIGIWGEWYYTTHFGDPNFLDWSNPDNERGLTPQNWADRWDVLKALLDAAPKSIQVQVRYPQSKPYYFDWTPTTEAEMKAQTDKARLSHHNDCFVSSRTDVGTYVDKAREYPYLQGDTVYSNIGGETCRKSTDEVDRHKCPTAKKEMEELHYSYMNQAYNREVLDEWVADGCYGEAHRRLGYRLVLRKATLPTRVYQSGRFCFKLELENVGYAAPFKVTDVAMLLRNGNNLFSATLDDVDVRTWQPGGTIVVNGEAYIPSAFAPGFYEVLLAIKHPKLGGFSDYNILLANREVPEKKKGLNNLLHTIQVMGGSIPGNPSCPRMTTAPSQDESKYDRVFCGWGGCDSGSDCHEFPITNPSFETLDSGWQTYGGGFTYTTESASHGTRSIKITNGGALQVFTFPSGTRAFQITADSRNGGISESDSNDYSIYCDIKFEDETWSYGEVARFTVGNSNWHSSKLQVNSGKVIAEGWCYAMFRNYNAGTAFFDNFKVWTSETTTGTCP